MKGKERSPVRKRSRILPDIPDGGGNHPAAACKKTGALSAGVSMNSSVKSGGSARKSLPSEKRESQDLDGHVASRTGSIHGYANNTTGSASKPHNVSLAPDPRTNPRGEPRTLAGNDSEYKTLKVSELGSDLNDEKIEDGLFHEFRKFGDVSVKISRVNDERVAFVNYRRPDDARAAKHARGKLVLHDRPLKIEPVYVNRRRSRSPMDKDAYAGIAEHRYMPVQRPHSPTGLGYRDFRLQQLALGRLPPPPPPHPRELERERDFSIYEARNRPPLIPDCAAFREDDLLSPVDDQRANRTLFLGNLDVSVTENDLRKAFDRFGVITEVDIKRTTTRGQKSTYGFLKFENLDMAHRAKISMSGKVVCHNPIKIGYGKATPTNRLWVGGLGPWVPLSALAREFDRFGTIRTIDYRKGDIWAYIQYESLDAAQAACSHMRGFPLGGPDRRVRVDFADTGLRYQQQYLPPHPLPPHALPPHPLPPHLDLVEDSFLHRPTSEASKFRERRSPPPLRFRERELYNADWAGPMIHERVRGAAFDPVEHLDRRSREPWSLECERELQSRVQVRKRRLLDDVRQTGPSPDSSEHERRRGNSLARSPEVICRNGGRYSPSHSNRTSPVREPRGSLDRGSGDKRLRTLSPSEPKRESKRQAKESCQSPAKREEHPTSSSSKSSLQSKQRSGGQKLCLAWQGTLLLKNSSFPTSMHLLDGDLAVAAGLLEEGSTGGQVSQLKITQRLRLDQPKLDEVSRRIRSAGHSRYSVLLAVSGSSEEGPQDVGSSAERPLKNLVSYLKQKQAAGVISLPVGGSRDKDGAGVLHAFPPCDFSQQFIDASAKEFAKNEEDYLVMVIVRGAS
ncbi:hypothetical protein DPEC_G00212030 [Dallia pectoralis]|uniref:Uncharacterized protein n=1 Tax=Dallia pectoralis TaxID=75939 RepID=A0ACC2G6A7_DALPE|nr:hypothetical protein DPEC_G00212030 [Dallia pectoralis]